MKINKLMLLPLIIILLSSFFQGCIQEETINKNDIFYVSLDGSKDFKSIQEAIDAAPQNITIFVYNGTYHENIIISKSIQLIGENSQTTIIDSNNNENTINLTADNIVISNFTIQNSGEKYGRDIAGIFIEANNTIITNNIITNHLVGIYSIYSKYTTIHNNTITLNKDYGIELYTNSHYSIIKDNNFYRNACSLRVKGSRYCSIFRNRFNNSNQGMYFCCGSQENVVYHNTFVNHTYYNANDQVNINQWNDETKNQGNYWDDYQGIDENNDGIGDMPYEITTTMKDNYPLMNPIV